MERIKPRTLSGFMELLPAPQTQFERMLEKLRATYSLYGFTPLDTPIIESAEILLAKGGGETEKQIYRFTKGDSDLALRFDLTVPLAKYVALHYADLAFPFRRYQIGKVYRGERAQRGRFREFYQCDIDVIGDGKLDISNEAEIPAIIYQAFTSLGLERFKIRVNNRKILTGFYAMQGLAEQSGEIMRTVDKLDKIGPEKVRALLIEGGVAEAAADEILKFIAITGENEEVLAALEGYRGRDPIFDQGLDELGTVVKYLGSFGVPADHFAVDLTTPFSSMATRLSWVTLLIQMGVAASFDRPEKSAPLVKACSIPRAWSDASSARLLLWSNLGIFQVTVPERSSPPERASCNVSGDASSSSTEVPTSGKIKLIEPAFFKPKSARVKFLPRKKPLP